MRELDNYVNTVNDKYNLFGVMGENCEFSNNQTPLTSLNATFDEKHNLKEKSQKDLPFYIDPISSQNQPKQINKDYENDSLANNRQSLHMNTDER